MQAVILAGGLGTRIRAESGDLPKALIPIQGVPFLFYQMSWLRQNGVSRVVVSVGYGADLIRKALAGRFGDITISFADEKDRLRGTGGALRYALDLGLLDEQFFVLYGDSYLPIDIAPIWKSADWGRVPTMSVMRNDSQWDKSNVVFRDGRVLLYDKRERDPAGAGMHYIDYGISVLQRDLVEHMVPADTIYDLADVFTPLSRAGALRGYEVTKRFYEIGSPDGLRSFREYVGQHPELLLELR